MLFGRENMPGNNLPVPLTSFVGRAKEIAEVRKLLAETRLLTLTGSGGCGKTRLALKVAMDVLDAFPNGVWFIDLSPLSDPALVPQAIASVFDLRQVSDTPITILLHNFLRDKNLLLILDNCEHLTQASAGLADSLLQTCPALEILATSREVLNVSGETLYRIPSLPLADPEPLPSLDTLAQTDAIRLFVERVRSVRTDFSLTDQNAPSVAQICARLDGMPLAIELAAARVKMLSVEQIAERLDDRFRLLTTGSRTAPSRQQTLRATMDWSYALLSVQEQRLLNRLSVFAGGWSLEAAEAVSGEKNHLSESTLDLLSHLADKSLVIVEERDGASRYRMLETIRQYALEKLAEADEVEWTRNRHLDFFLHLAEEARPNLNGPDPLKWLRRLDVEHDNLRFAVRTAQEHKATAKGLRLVSALGKFWQARGFLSEGRALAALFLAPSDGMDSSTKLIRIQVLIQTGWFAVLQNDYAMGDSLLNESIALCQELGDETGVAQALVFLGFVAFNQGNTTLAHSRIDKAVALLTPQGDKRTLASAFNFLGMVFREEGDYGAARALMEEALGLRRALEEKGAIASSLNDLGATAFAQGDPSAESLLETSLEMRRELEDRFGIPRCLHDLGAVALGGDDLAHAYTRFSEALADFRDQGDKRNAIKCLEGLAGVAAAAGQIVQAARLLGAAQFAREAIGVPLPITWRANYDRALSVVRKRLDQATFASAWAEGRAMSLEQAMEYILAEPYVKISATNAKPAHDPNSLTPREMQVLRLVAAGLSDAHIAKELVVSARTVNAHLGSIYSKLGVNSRSAAMRYALDHKLI
jgi:non-specific serine/threonine protein kinase